MSKNKAKEAVPADKPARPSRKKPARKAARGKPADIRRFDFVGKVESIVVTTGGEADVFEFGLRGRQGARQTFRLKTSESFALNVMAPIVTSAHATEAKIGVRIAPVEGGVPYVVEVASRPKLLKEA
jgi:hypothetical protein